MFDLRIQGSHFTTQLMIRKGIPACRDYKLFIHPHSYLKTYLECIQGSWPNNKGNASNSSITINSIFTHFLQRASETVKSTTTSSTIPKPCSDAHHPQQQIRCPNQSHYIKPNSLQTRQSPTASSRQSRGATLLSLNWATTAIDAYEEAEMFDLNWQPPTPWESSWPWMHASHMMGL